MTSAHSTLNPIERYQAYRTRKFLANEAKWAKMLPGWRTVHRRRMLVIGLVATLVFMFAVGVVCAFRVEWAPLLWLPACLAFFPLWITLQIVSGRQGDAPREALDEWEIEQRDSARSVGLAVTQGLVMIPVCYLVFGAVITQGTDTSMAYAGGVMTLATLMAGGCTPAMILAWTRPEPDPDDSVGD